MPKFPPVGRQGSVRPDDWDVPPIERITESETTENVATTKLEEIRGASEEEGEDEQKYFDYVAEMHDFDHLHKIYMNYVEERTRNRPDQDRPLSLPTLVEANEHYSDARFVLSERQSEGAEPKGREEPNSTTTDKPGAGPEEAGSTPVAGGRNVLRPRGAAGPQLPDYRTLDTLLSDPISTRPLLCGTILERGVVTGVVAAPGSGKTTLVGQLAVALANGLGWAGQRIPGPLRVVYANLEENLDERRRRFAGIAKHMGVTDHDVLRRVLLWSGGRMRLMEKKDGSAAPTPAFENLRAAILAHRADVLVIDPAPSCTGWMRTPTST